MQDGVWSLKNIFRGASLSELLLNERSSGVPLLASQMAEAVADEVAADKDGLKKVNLSDFPVKEVCKCRTQYDVLCILFLYCRMVISLQMISFGGLF